MAVAIDASTPVGVVNNGGGSVTSASFTPPASAALIATITGNQAGTTAGLTLTMSNTGPTITWSRFIQEDCSQAGVDYGAAAIFTAQLPASSTAMTVTVTETGSGTSKDTLGLKVWVVTGANLGLTGGSSRGSSTTNNLTTTAFTSADAGLVFAAGSDWNSLGTPTSSDLLSTFTGTNAGALSYLHGYHTIAAAGSSVTANIDASGASAPKWSWVTGEIRPAAAAKPVPFVSQYSSYH